MVKINLLPIKSELRQKALIEHVTLLSLCIVLIFVLSWIVQTSITNKKDMLEKEVTATRIEITALTKEAGEIEKFKEQKQELQRKLDIITDLNAKKSGPVEILDQLSIIIPDKVWITNMVNNGNNLNLDGMAVDNPTIALFMKNMLSSPYFQGVELQMTQKEGMNQKFSIKCQIKLPG